MHVQFPLIPRWRYALRRLLLAWSVRSGQRPGQDLDEVFSAADVDREPGEVAVVAMLASTLGYRHMIDVGANHGDFSRNVRRQVGAMSVLLVEPNPTLCMLLKRWAANHVGVEVLHAAVSNQAGHIELFIPQGHTGGASVSAAFDASRVGQKIEVAAVTLSELLSERPADFIKIDVEGHEVAVFEGTTAHVKQSVATSSVFGFECSDARSFEQIRALLPGYRFFVLEPYWPSGKRAWAFAAGVLAFLLRSTWRMQNVEGIDGYRGLIFAAPQGSPGTELLAGSQRMTARV